MDQYEFGLKCREDPVFFCEAVLNWFPTPVQKEIMYSVRDNRRTAVKSAHGVGKSGTAARIVVWFLTMHPNAIVYTTAPTMRQVTNILWGEIRSAWHSPSKQLKLQGHLLPSAPRIELGDKWWAQGFATSDPDSFQGLHGDYVLAIFDEASGIPDVIWDASDGNLATGTARFLAIANPTDPNSRFFKECLSEKTNTITISAFDTPNFTIPGITQKHIEDRTWRQLWTEALDTVPMPYANKLVTPEYVEGVYTVHGPDSPVYSSRVLGEFPESSSDSLIDIKLIKRAQRRWDEYKNNPDEAKVKPGQPVILGTDVAEGSGDETVIFPRADGYVYTAISSRKAEPTETVGTIIRVQEDRFPTATIHIDAIGVGSGPASQLREAGKSVRSIKAGNKAKNTEMFHYLKDEYYWGLRQRFVDDTIAIPSDDEELETQLSKLRVVYDSAGRIKIIDKAEMRKALNGRSPDRAEALMLAFASGVVPYADSSKMNNQRVREAPEIERERTIKNLIKMSQGGGFFF